MDKMDIESLRSQIDLLDDKIKDLLIKRLSLCDEIGKIKKELDLNILSTGREEDILNRLTNGLSDLDKESVKLIYKQIFKVSKCRQENIKNG